MAENQVGQLLAAGLGQLGQGIYNYERHRQDNISKDAQNAAAYQFAMEKGWLKDPNASMDTYNQADWANRQQMGGNSAQVANYMQWLKGFDEQKRMHDITTALHYAQLGEQGRHHKAMEGLHSKDASPFSPTMVPMKDDKGNVLGYAFSTSPRSAQYVGPTPQAGDAPVLSADGKYFLSGKTWRQSRAPSWLEIALVNVGMHPDQAADVAATIANGQVTTGKNNNSSPSQNAPTVNKFTPGKTLRHKSGQTYIVDKNGIPIAQ